MGLMGRNLTGLALAGIERPAEKVSGLSAYCLDGSPEIPSWRDWYARSFT